MAWLVTETWECLKEWFENKYACYNRAYGGSEENVVGKQDGAFVILPRECLKKT